jgi:hypothetical protein
MLNHYTKIGKGGGGTDPQSATVPAQSIPLGKNVILSSMVGFGSLILEGSHHFGRAVWNRGASNRGFQGRRSRFEVWVVHLLWTIIFNTRGE